jgi:hypothetical protein
MMILNIFEGLHGQFPLHLPTRKDAVQHNKIVPTITIRITKIKKDIAELFHPINQSNSQFNPWSC